MAVDHARHFSIPALPSSPGTRDSLSSHTIVVFLFVDVSNSAELQQQLTEGALDPACALFNASLVPSVFTVLQAAAKAAHSSDRQSLRTRSVHSEIVFNLAGSRHIGPSLAKFGIATGCPSVFLVLFDPGEEAIRRAPELVRGRSVALDELGSVSDREAIKVAYKISDNELRESSLEQAVATRIAARDLL